jgi:hypothetical protein
MFFLSQKSIGKLRRVPDEIFWFPTLFSELKNFLQPPAGNPTCGFHAGTYRA